MSLQLRYPEEADFHSRAFLDDEEAIPQASSAIFRWTPVVRTELAQKSEKWLSPSRLIVATGKEATSFARQLTNDNTELIATLLLSSTPIVNTTFASGPEAISSIVALSPDTLLLQAPLNVPEEAIWTFIDALFDHIRPQEVISLSSLLSVMYDSELHNGCVLYRLSNANSLIAMEIPTLPTPRFVSGIPAALLTYVMLRFCSLRKQRASLFLTLQHPTTTVPEAVKCMNRLLPSLKLNAVSTSSSIDTKSFEDLYI
ncbi:hypothetical protein THRCLA_20827 [Thraustotheca clavata]|uniref:Uncharacterized protein n=1 Tax=Thraustotheca clavata TaxID=74557 RepID=A0A1W0A339_9STRA|nr:hypothetical protein THRCLA_20827 [Thraustotheca clavata]